MAGKNLKVYISADMEGVAGVVGPEQLFPPGFEYEKFRAFMTAEVCAAIDGARDAGATEFVISDSHGNGQNLLLDALPDDVELVRGWPRSLGMMEGIDDTFGAALLIGYHTGVGNIGGIAAHTLSSKHVSSLKLNGVEMPEGGLSALIAGHFGVPVVMASGDDAVIDELTSLLGRIEGAAVKTAITHTSCQSMMPAAARKLIREKAKLGVAARNDIKPFTMPSPLTLELRYKNAIPAQTIASLGNVELVASRTVRFSGDIIEVSGFLETALGYPSTMP